MSSKHLACLMMTAVSLACGGNSPGHAGPEDVQAADTWLEDPATAPDIPAKDGSESQVLQDSSVISDALSDSVSDTPQDAIHPKEGFKRFDLTDVGNVRGMWAAADGKVWAVGDGGTILYFNGADFVPAPPAPVDVDLYGVSGTMDTVFMVGAQGTVLKYRDGKFEKLPQPTQKDLYAVGALSPDDFLVAGADGALYRYRNGDWEKQNTGLTYDFHGIHVSKVGGFRVVGEFGTLLEMKGNHWVQSQIGPPSSTLRSIWRAPDGTMVAVGDKGTVVLFDGFSWKLQVTVDPYDPPRDLYACFGFSAEDIHAVGDQGLLLRYNGKKWTLVSIAGPYNTLADFRAIAGYVDNDGKRHVFAAGLDSRAIELKDQHFVDFTLGVRSDLRDVSVLKDGTVAAVGGHGLVLLFDDGRFGSLEVATVRDLNAISSDIAVGDGGTVVFVKPDGAKLVELDQTMDFVDVDANAATPGQDALLLSRSHGVFGLDRQQQTADVVTKVPAAGVHTLCRAEDSTIFVGGAGGAMFAGNAESGLSKLFTGTFSSVHDLLCDFFGKGTALAVGDNGLVLKCSLDGCEKLHQEPIGFFYGVSPAGKGQEAIVVGWAGEAAFVNAQGNVTEVETGLVDTFLGVARSASKGTYYLAGQGGAFVVYEP